MKSLENLSSKAYKVVLVFVFGFGFFKFPAVWIIEDSRERQGDQLGGCWCHPGQR